MTVAVVSIHDVAPATFDESEYLLALVERVGLRSSLLVVPGPWQTPTVGDDRRFQEWLRTAAARGHEVVAHGWEHRAVVDPEVHVPAHRRAVERVKTRGCAEFAALGYGEACRRASASLDALTALGFAPTGFVAPGWSLSPQAHQALATVGFRYTTTRRDVIDLATSVPTPIPAVCHRPGSMVSGAAARAVASWVQRRCRGGRAVRFALHPADVLDDRLDGATVRALDAIADSPLRAVTYQELVDAASTTELRVAS